MQKTFRYTPPLTPWLPDYWGMKYMKVTYLQYLAFSLTNNPAAVIEFVTRWTYTISVLITATKFKWVACAAIFTRVHITDILGIITTTNKHVVNENVVAFTYLPRAPQRTVLLPESRFAMMDLHTHKLYA